MNLLETIETSKTWTCPKTGWWKVICVGGGASLTYNSNNNTAIGEDGEATSFGTHLTALGGEANVDDSLVFLFKEAFIGFDVANINLYGTIADTRKVIHTYGRSGTTGTATSTSGFKGAPKCGRIKVGITHIDKGEIVACSVGRAVPPTVTSGSVSEGNIKGATGTDGVIVVQYLGAEV